MAIFVTAEDGLPFLAVIACSKVPVMPKLSSVQPEFSGFSVTVFFGIRASAAAPATGVFVIYQIDDPDAV